MDNKDQSLPMNENEVVDAICSYLTSTGHTILVRRTTTEQGDDVVAEHSKTQVLVYVEAKGGTSSRDGSARYGKSYTQTQVFDRVAKGIFTCLQTRTKYPNRNSVRVILALPEKPDYFKKYIDTVMPSLIASGIEVWFAK